MKLIPMNKQVILQPIKPAEKVGTAGLIWAPDSALERQHKLGRVTAFDPCDEAKHLAEGDVVVYDAIGAVEHTVEGQKFTTVKVLNIVTIVRPDAPEDGLNAAIVGSHG